MNTMPEKPLISIITVNLNDVEGLKRTMTSVFGQTYKEFEYIVIDGGSTDGSKGFIENHSDKIDYWVSEKDTGVYNGMNKGIKKATGAYLLFLNSGDYLIDDNILFQSLNELASYDLIYFNFKVFTGSAPHVVSYPEQLGFIDLFKGTICHQSVFIKKELFTTIGLYDEKLKIVSDWKFLILALFKFNYSYKKVGKLLTMYNSDGMSADPQNEEIIISERKKVLNEYFQNFFSEVEELDEYRKKIKELRNSKKINFLIRFGLLNKF